MEFSTEVVTLPLVVVLVLCCSVPPSLAQATNISGSAFNCPPLEMSNSTPTSVHSLRPSDIIVIGAMGNSLTAGFGVLSTASSIYGNRTDFRGLAWSAGGDANLSLVTTLPNILRQYSPDLFGFSTGVTLSDEYRDHPGTRFNVARSGAHALEMLQQARDLVEKIRVSDNIDFETDWKLVTVYIGLNDLCLFTCTNNREAIPAVWIQRVRDGLDYLRDNLPRTFVNLVQLLDSGDAARALVADSTVGLTCRSFYFSVCPCGPFGSDSIGEEFDDLTQQYQENMRDLVNSGRYDRSNDFTVVLQPFQSNIQLDEMDPMLFAVDCSHLSPIGNREFAIALWNNMFERVGEKTSTLRQPVELICPTDEEPFLLTAQNMSGGRHLSQSLMTIVLVQILMIKMDI